jgi:polyisoprenoid-binding protein YceI
MNVGTRTTITPATYLIDTTRSTVQFVGTHAFGLGAVHGTFAVRDGTVVIAEAPEHSSVSVRMDPASFRTDKARRDADVTGKRFLKVAAYPEMSFASTGLAPSADGWRLTGILTVHGTPAEVLLDLADAAPTADGCRFAATTRIDRYAFGVTGGRGIVGRHLDVRIDVVATAAAAK